MKKVLSFMLVCLAIIPVMFFAGCKNSENAEAVKNRTYYVTTAKRSTEDFSQTCKNANFRISFFTDHFKVEYGTSANTTTYGYYIGTYETAENKVTLTITEFGGTFVSSTTSVKEMTFSKFTYEKGKLRTEFVVGSNIMQYVLELPAEN